MSSHDVMRWLAVQERAAELLRTCPDWRHGQALFNALHEMDPALADQIRGTSLDPFYSDSKERVLAFAATVMTRDLPPTSPAGGVA